MKDASEMKYFAAWWSFIVLGLKMALIYNSRIELYGTLSDPNVSGSLTLKCTFYMASSI